MAAAAFFGSPVEAEPPPPPPPPVVTTTTTTTPEVVEPAPAPDPERQCLDLLATLPDRATKHCWVPPEVGRWYLTITGVAGTTTFEPYLYLSSYDYRAAVLALIG